MAGLTDSHQVFLSVGSNLGDKLSNCLEGIAVLTGSGESVLHQTSLFYRTAPVDFTEQDWFVNAVVKIGTSLAPIALLDRLLAIQRRFGRRKDTVRFGPRVLDLDILLYDNRSINEPHLNIPHPRMHKRAFVLQPICDIDPAIVHPVLGVTVADLLKRIEGEDQQVVPLENQPAVVHSRKP